MNVKTLLALQLVSLYVIAQSYTASPFKHAMTGTVLPIPIAGLNLFNRIPDILGNLIPVKYVNNELSAISGSHLPGNHCFIPCKKESETVYGKRI